MIIGAVMPLIPGVPFVNGVRDLANSDYIAGMTRLTDALLGFFCIAIGVAFSFLLDGWAFGGMIAQSFALAEEDAKNIFRTSLQAALVQGVILFAFIPVIPNLVILSDTAAGYLRSMLLISCVNKLCNVVTAYSRIIDKDQGDSFADQIQVFLISFFSLPGEPAQVFEHDRIAFMKGLLQLDPFAPDEILTGRIITIDPDIIDLVFCGIFL